MCQHDAKEDGRTDHVSRGSCYTTPVTKFWSHKPPALPIVLAALLTLILAVLQYYWVGQVSQSAQERMQASLRAGAARFSEDFDRELARAYLSFQMDAATLRDRAWARYAQRYAHWMQTAPYPQLVRDVYLVQVDQSGRIQIARFDPMASGFTAIIWPAELAGLRQRFEALYHVASAQTDAVAGEGLDPVVEEGPAIVIPLARLWLLSDQQDVDLAVDLLYADTLIQRPRKGCWACPTPADPLFAYTVVALDRAWMQQVLIPTLARRYFSSSDGVDYTLAIVSRSNPAAVIYQSDAPLSKEALTSGDATVGLLSVRLDELNRLLLDNALLQSGPDDGEPESERLAVGILGRTPSGPPSVGAGPATGDTGLWRLVLTHRAGSLEAAVASLRLRNLAISFGTLLLLALSVAMLIASTRRAQRLAQQKMAFVAAISHELRTPLAVICAAGENLADGVVHDPQRARQYGAVIHTEGRRLTELVEQALEFAGAQSSPALYRPRPVAIDSLVAQALGSCQPQLGESGCQIEVVIQPDLPLVMADPAALQRSIQNLLTNAIKYCGQQHWIGICAQAGMGPHGPEVRITVRDRGPGIAPDDLPHIFEPFYRGRSAIEAQIRGSGLGLSLVKSIAEAHGGCVRVESVLGQGSAFTLCLPATDQVSDRDRSTEAALRWPVQADDHQ